MLDKANEILVEARALIEAAEGEAGLEALRIKYLGKKGALTSILRSMGSLSPEERKVFGQQANAARIEIENLLDEKKKDAANAAKEERFVRERVDVTEPGKVPESGNLHPITQTIDEISRIFISMGYSIVEGPEVETVFHNFDALNAAPNHPSRDLSDTFYITENTLLRTQTSPVQIRTLQDRTPPIKVISPGRVFRPDTPDATHSPVFHQIEGLLVDEGVTMADLKGTLETWAKRMFGAGTVTKFRPHFFPFT
ncbi:MAG: phenylalanine--tRNA ligase subunit alpha, partial [Clostridiales Family XIII bacterium]|nr:phenylalanine--tRNA ligase subunit alpha [Clostridiales Family XIII bacterium]